MSTTSTDYRLNPDLELLIVDDSWFARNRARLCLQNLGLTRIQEASNGRDALQFYRQNPVDLILIDIVMEDMNGLETLKALKQEFPQCRIIMVSAVDVPAILSDCIACGIEDFVVKPYDTRDLQTAVLNALSWSSKQHE